MKNSSGAGNPSNQQSPEENKSPKRESKSPAGEYIERIIRIGGCFDEAGVRDTLDGFNVLNPDSSADPLFLNVIFRK